MSDENSYIYIEDDKFVRIQCVECHENNKLGEFWNANNGYGPWDIICKCGKVIHKEMTKHTKKDTNV